VIFLAPAAIHRRAHAARPPSSFRRKPESRCRPPAPSDLDPGLRRGDEGTSSDAIAQGRRLRLHGRRFPLAIRPVPAARLTPVIFGSDHRPAIAESPMKSLVLAAVLFLACGPAAAAPANFIYTGNGDLAAAEAILAREDIAGAQVVYNWRALEPAMGVYDFSDIERDLALTDRLGKKLFVQVQDRFFSPEARNIPDYLLTDPAYSGGLVPQLDNPGENQPTGYGWATMQWNPAVRARYQALLKALAERFDGRIYGINLPETSIDVDTDHPSAGFTCDGYFAAELENLGYARDVFRQSQVVQYVNFWPCEWGNDHDYMSRTFEFALQHGAGLGGPDIVPYRRGQMMNSYPFFNRYKGKLAFVGMAVQEPTLTYTNEETGKPFSREEFTAFATDYLGVDAIFWSVETPWLKEAR
jgi:hypothetical protein